MPLPDPAVTPFGDSAVLVKLDGPASAQTLARELRRDPPPGVIACVPGLESLLVQFDPLATDDASVRQLVAARLGSAPADEPAASLRTIPVVYGGEHGPDLDEVARLTGRTAQDVIDAHSTGELRVLFDGFAPGFAYVGDLPEAIRVPRLATPRNCGNILAGVGPFAIEQGLVAAIDNETAVRIHMVNSGSIAVAHVRTPEGVVTYEGDARIDGVPGTAAPVMLDFEDIAGSSCGALLPTGALSDIEQGIEVTCIDNGMPVAIVRASDFGKTGAETPQELEADDSLKNKIEAIRIALGQRMNLGDVTLKTVPKMCLVSAAIHGGAIATRTFIPHRVHESIGVLGAASVAAACLIPGTVAQKVAETAAQGGVHLLDIEHPTGFLTVETDLDVNGSVISIRRSALLHTARKLMQGNVFVPVSIWSGHAC